MAVPFINIFANTMGGIGTIELNDYTKLVNGLKQRAGVPFYAGRFYPTKTAEEWNFLSPGFLAQTPPWLTWADMGDTPIVMVSQDPNEFIIGTTTEITHIDVWPRDQDVIDALGRNPDEDVENLFHQRQIREGWGESPDGGSRDPGINIDNEFILPVSSNPLWFVLALFGQIAVSELDGHCTDYAFYDHSVIILNGYKYNQAHYKGKARNFGSGQYIGKEVDYQEIFILRADGVWKKEDAKVSSQGQPDIQYTREGYPANGFFRVASADMYEDWVITDRALAQTYGVERWNQYLKIDTLTDPEGRVYEVPAAGVILGAPTSRLDQVVYTIKVSCVSIIIVKDQPDPAREAERISLASSALATFGANIINNVWYFYMPVRFSGTYSGPRVKYIQAQSAVNRIQSSILTI